VILPSGRERRGRGGFLSIQGEGLLINCGCCRGWACTSIGTAFYEICRRERETGKEYKRK